MGILDVPAVPNTPAGRTSLAASAELATAIAQGSAPPARTRFSPVITKIIADSDKPYIAWPGPCMIVDEARGYIAQAYTAGLVHAADNGDAEKVVRVRRRKLNSPVWEAAVTISNQVSGNLDSETQAAGLAPNGDWIVLVRRSPNTTWGTPYGYLIYRSTDGGLSWVEGQMRDASGNAALPAAMMDWFVTNSGAILSTYKSGSTWNYFVARSTAPNGGNPWLVHGTGGAGLPVANLGGSQGALEGTYCQLGSGRIISLVRATVTAPPYTSTVRAKFTYSDDDGISWAAAVDSDVISMTNQAATMHYHPDTDMVEMICADRYANGPDAKGSLWHYLTPASEAAEGRFGVPERLYAASGSHRDFGQPGLKFLSDGTAILHFYDRNGAADTAAIYEMRGQRLAR